MLNDSTIYQFEKFTLDEDEGKLFHDDMRIELQRIQFKALLLLVKNAGNTVTKDHLANDVWGYAASDNSITNCISIIRKKLDESNRERFIETVSGKIEGYKFILPVTQVEKTSSVLISKETVARGAQSSSADFSERTEEFSGAVQTPLELPHSPPQVFGIHNTLLAIFGMIVAFIFFYFGATFRICAEGACFEQTVFIILATVFYGVLVGIGVLLECAYDFDRYGWNAAKMIPSIVFVSAGAMFAALTVAGNLLQENGNYAFWKGLLFLVMGALISCILAAFVLPNAPVTAAKFQTQSAIGAFCKNVIIYFLPLYTVFGLLIFCFVFGTSELTKSVAFPIAFAIVWMVFFVFSYLSTNYLSDNLLTKKDDEKYKYHGLFSLLLQLRMIFCFITALGSIFWYFFHALTHTSFGN